MGLEHQRARAILPRGLEGELETAIGTPSEALLGQRRPHHIASEPLQLFPVAAVDHLLRVQVDPKRFGHGLGCQTFVRRYAGEGPAHSEAVVAWLRSDPERGVVLSSDATGSQRWLTQAEQSELARNTAEAQRLAAEHQRATEAQRRIVAEEQRAAEARRRAELEAQAERLALKLRALGVDPEA